MNDNNNSNQEKKSSREKATDQATQAVSSSVGKSAGATLASALGATGAFVGNIFGFVIGSLVGTAINKVRKNPKDALALGIAITSVVIGTPVAMLAGLVTAGFLIFWGSIFAILLGFITTILIIIAAEIVVVAFTLYIINSGAYVVPPGGYASTSSGGVQQSQSPYITVSKTYSPKPTSASFPNDTDIRVTYTITISAPITSLTNITFSSTCKVVSDSFNTCPAVGNVTVNGQPVPNNQFPPPAPDVLTITDPPYVITYEVLYRSGQFNDSLLIDAFTVEATASNSQESSTGNASVSIGNPPVSCPSIWPIHGKYGITQGPHGTYSHSLINAIDIATPMGTPVIATHNGIAHVEYTNGDYRPVYIDITSTCGTVTFSSRYAHLSAVSIRDGQMVQFGQEIGASGSDGTGPHLHYEFRNGLQMIYPYLPRTVQDGCNDVSSCGYTTPSN